jgi:Glycosyltransferase family 87
VIVVAAFVTMLITARLAGWRPHSPTDYLAVAAVAVTFSPLRDGLSVDQIDPALCCLTLLGLYIGLRHRASGGLLQGLAMFKPQGTLVASAGACWGARGRFATSALIALACVFVASLGLSALGMHVGWVSWLHALRSASQQKHPHSLVEIALLLPVTAALVLRAWRSAPQSIEQRMIWSLAIAAAANGALAPLVFPHLHSDVLLCVPAAIVAFSLARRGGPVRDQVAFGIVLGVLFVDGLFPVVYYSGLSHAALPVVLATLLAVAAAVRFPSLRLSLFVGLIVNCLVTVPPVGETLPVWFSVVGSLLLLALLPDSRAVVSDVLQPRFAARSHADASFGC